MNFTKKLNLTNIMNKSLLKQALKFKDNSPTYSQVEKLSIEAKVYQSENDVIFLYAKYKERTQILNKELFFEFISNRILQNDGIVNSFEDIEKIFNAQTRQENIKASGDSKNSIVRVFDNVVVYQIANNNPILYKNHSEIKVKEKILAVENGETFLNIYSIMSKFGFNEFVYLGGFSNTSTREFLKDKDVVFFLDYDIEAIRIYDSFNCKSKSFFIHPEIENYFKNNNNQKLYLEQRDKLPEKHAELQWLLNLIDEYSAVVEQEIIA